MKKALVVVSLIVVVFGLVLCSGGSNEYGLREDIELKETVAVKPSLDVAQEIVMATLNEDFREELIDKFPDIVDKNFRFFYKWREFTKQGEDGWTKYFVVALFKATPNEKGEVLENQDKILEFLVSKLQKQITIYYDKKSEEKLAKNGAASTSS